MFSQESRRILSRNPLSNVICQLRFPDILIIGANLPVEFQNAIREDFPQYSAKKEPPLPKLAGTPGNLHLEKQDPATNYSFTSADGIWSVNLTNNFISLSCRRYTCWEDFAAHLDKPLAAFIQIYRPAYFTRVGLRYLNFISRKALQLEHVPFRDLIAPCYLGVLAMDDLPESAVTRCAMDTEFAIGGGCKAKIHAGPGLVKQIGQTDTEPKFIFDLDLFMPGNIPINHSAGTLQTLHNHAYPLFRGGITDTLLDALESTPL